MEMRLVEEELKKGWEATSQLRGLVLKGENQSNELDNKKLLTFGKNYCATIIKSFDNCISILNSSMEASNNPQISSLRRDTPNHAPSIQALRNFGELKSKNPRVRSIETPNLAPDGYLWRKYGRKPIQHAKHPREYYRCAYRDDQNCQATKHVQMITKNPTMYKIIYYSHHICQPDLFSNNNVSNIQQVLDLHDKDCTNNLISFESKPRKQALKPSVQANNNDPSSSFDGGSMSYMVPQTNDHGEGPSTSKCVDFPKSTINEQPLTVDIDWLKQMDVVNSPSLLMSPNYIMDGKSSFVHQLEDYSSLITPEQHFDFGGALQLQDITYYEDDDQVAAYTYPDLFSS